VQPLWKKIWRLLKNLNIDLPYDLAISLLGMYTKERDTVTWEAPEHPCLLQRYSQKPKLWKQPRCPTIDKCIKKMGYLYTGILLSHEKNEILSFASKWMDLENIILSEISQAQKTKNRMSSSYADFRCRANKACYWT
jgi:hypothetical protein